MNTNPPELTDDEIRAMWRDAGGSFHGPKVETGTMPEDKLLPFLRTLLAKLRQGGEPVADERAAFDEWIYQRVVAGRGYGHFDIWQARAALASAPVAPAPDGFVPVAASVLRTLAEPGLIKRTLGKFSPALAAQLGFTPEEEKAIEAMYLAFGESFDYPPAPLASAPVADLRHELNQLGMTAHTALNQDARDMRNIMEDLADRLLALAGGAPTLRAPVAGEPFMYGIMGPDGKAYFDEVCVSAEHSELQAEVVDHLNCGSAEGGTYTVVALFRSAAPQASASVFAKLQSAYVGACDQIAELLAEKEASAKNAPVAGEARRPHLNVVLDHAADRLADAGMREDASIVRGMKVPNDGSKTEPFNAAPQASAACATDVCRAGQQDGVLCANDECDRANGVRPAPQPAEGEVVLPPLPSPYDARGEYIGYARRDVEAYARAAILADRQQRAALASKEKNDA